MRHPDEIMSDNKRVLGDLVELLHAGEIKYVLVGGLLSSLYGKPRATVDVDLLIPGHAKHRLALELAGRGYRVESNEDMLRIYKGKGKTAVADLVVREANPILKAASATARSTELLGITVDVVSRGAYVALKFHAAISPTRRVAAKQQDIADIASVVEHGLPAGAERQALRIAAMIYPGAEDELRAVLDDLRHGRTVRL